MMVKSQSGVPLQENIDWNMCQQREVAVGGFDLISYRQEGGPVMGKDSIVAEHAGRTYWFESEDNREKFRANPDKFLPAYGGFCAVTLALGRVTCPDYTNFKVENDRLLLFEVTGFTNGRTLWNSDVSGFRKQADGNFDRLTALQ